MLNVGIVGLGFMGMTHYNAYKKVDGAKIAAVCEADPVRLSGDWRSIQGNFGPRGEIVDLEGIAKYSSLDDLVADPNIDMVDICLPPVLHPAASIAARAGPSSGRLRPAPKRASITNSSDSTKSGDRSSTSPSHSAA